MLSVIRGFFDRLSLNARLVLVVSVVVLGLFGLNVNNALQ
jgi:methyl-accepting chemotaxis protein